MVQLWIDVDDGVDLVALCRSDDPRLRRVALFDAVINNADRKGGHLLPAPSGRVYGIDHGVTFHVQDKLRTLLWTWRGQCLRPDELAALACVRDAVVEGRAGGDTAVPPEAHVTGVRAVPGAWAGLASRLRDLLTGSEVDALTVRIDRLLTGRTFPHPSGDWPALPWPPF
jgi:hypothetical protein